MPASETGSRRAARGNSGTAPATVGEQSRVSLPLCTSTGRRLDGKPLSRVRRPACDVAARVAVGNGDADRSLFPLTLPYRLLPNRVISDCACTVGAWG